LTLLKIIKLALKRNWLAIKELVLFGKDPFSPQGTQQKKSTSHSASETKSSKEKGGNTDGSAAARSWKCKCRRCFLFKWKKLRDR
jgi:hypothetical protein